MLTSGYNMSVLPHCWLAMISGLAGFNLKIAEPVPLPDEMKENKSLAETKQVLKEVKRYLKDYWKCLQ